MATPKTLYGFHAVGVRLKTAPSSVLEIYYDASRRDARMRQFIDRANQAGVRLIQVDAERLAKLSGGHGHQGVVALAQPMAQAASLDELLEQLEATQDAAEQAAKEAAEEGSSESADQTDSEIATQTGTDSARSRASGADVPHAPLILVLDGVTDPHNLGAVLRVADGAGAHAVIAPKDHAVGINATVSKVASGAAETVPYFMVTNLARTLNELKERNIWIIGTSDDASQTIYDVDLTGPVALVLGAEGPGMRQLTRKTCDALVRIPMRGAVESLNVSVASGVCLYEALRQRECK